MNAAVDVSITMAPSPLAIRRGNSALVRLSEPITLTSYMVCQSASCASATYSMPNAPPATLTSTSHRSRDCANASTAATSVTSRISACAEPPRARAWAAASSSRSARRAARITWKPALASCAAVAAPIPLLAPVTTATGCMSASRCFEPHYRPALPHLRGRQDYLPEGQRGGCRIGLLAGGARRDTVSDREWHGVE